MCYQIKYAYTSHIGKIRGNNEDNFWCCGNTLPADNRGSEGIHTGVISRAKIPALAVFDGMGGESCGEMAAFLASEEFGNYYEMNKKNLRRNPNEFVEGLCRSMNQAVCRYGDENRISSMGTTVAMLLFGAENIYACNLGDSRVYAADEDGFSQISTDHVIGKYAFGKAPLTQYLGIPEEQQFPEPAVSELKYKTGKRFLLCSDGMTDMLSDGEIADILTREIPLESTVEVLLERVLAKGARDNVTIVLCELQQPVPGERLKKWLGGLRKENVGEAV